jgi:hypothetical protein
MTDLLKQTASDNNSAPALNSLASTAKSRWTFINDSKVEPQSDDREPMFGAVAAGTTSLPAGRSSARRKHQAMYKEWSQSRHD